MLELSGKGSDAKPTITKPAKPFDPAMMGAARRRRRPAARCARARQAAGHQGQAASPGQARKK